MRLIESESYSNQAQCVESHWRDVSTLSSKYSYANCNSENLRGSAKRSSDPDMATSSSEPTSTAACGAARSCIQTAEQMDSSGSVRPFGGTACWRRRVGRGAAGGAAAGSRCLFRAIVKCPSAGRHPSRWIGHKPINRADGGEWRCAHDSRRFSLRTNHERIDGSEHCSITPRPGRSADGDSGPDAKPLTQITPSTHVP